MSRNQHFFLTIALLLFGSSFSHCYGALMFNFNYSFPPWEPGGISVAGSGTLTTEETLTNGGYLILSITGTRTVTTPATETTPVIADTQDITGLRGVDTWWGNTNLVYPGGLLLDEGGMAFIAGNLPVNVYLSSTGGYTEAWDPIGYGTFELTALTAQTSVPEPSSTLLVGAGLVVVSALLRRTRKSS
jgi:hypothetical protein